MSRPGNARVRAVRAFSEDLLVARRFMQEQDVASAPVRFARLQVEIANAREFLQFAPAGGRPARFMAARSEWGRFQAKRAASLAQKLGTPDIRELVLMRHVLLYANSATEVLLLALRHQRQAGFLSDTQRPTRSP